MLTTLRRVAATGFATAAIFGTVAGPATAQPIVTGGLVDITINDVLSHNDVNVAAALNIAANICGVNVNVLAQQIGTGDATCRTGDQVVRITQEA